MARSKEILQTTPTFVLSRAYDAAAHADPARRGGYLLLVPGERPEIVLDGLASAEEQHAAELRCMREMEAALFQAQVSGHDREQHHRRRMVLRMTTDLVVTVDHDPEAHADPRRRGGYVVQAPGQIPEIVLDGLASEEEQREAELRCMRQLQEAHRPAASADSVNRLKELIARKRSLSAQSTPRSAQRIGARLVQRGLVREVDLQRALEQQSSLRADEPVRRIVSLLVEAGRLSMEQAARELGAQRGVDPSSGHITRVDAALRGLFPLDGLLELQAAPLFVAGRTVAVAMCDPHRADSVSVLQSLTSHRVRPLQAPQLQVQRLLASLKRS